MDQDSHGETRSEEQACEQLHRNRQVHGVHLAFWRQGTDQMAQGGDVLFLQIL